jgi:ribonuclease VapC
VTIFIDASAMVALLLKEDDHEQLTERLDAEDERIWSAIARWETVVNIARVREYSPERAGSDVDELASQLDIRLVPIGEEAGRLAVQAFAAFGKGTGHPAQLNMGDCFAYACAKANDASLLYKGDDFARTDLA